MASNNFVYSSEPGLITGFHGCSQTLRDNVVIGKTSLRQSNNPWDWLGVDCAVIKNIHEQLRKLGVPHLTL
jgi:hypothetical protein